MLIPDLILTPGLAERLRACGDEPLIVQATPSPSQWPFRQGIVARRADLADLSESEQRRVEAVIAAHRAQIQ